MKNRQQGIALVMVLVFLLLMTLMSATAIKQNSLQFTMIGNAQEHSQSFANAENILRLVEQNIDQMRWSAARTGNTAGVDNDNWNCANAGGNYSLIAPGTDVGPGTPGTTAIIQEWWCQNNPDITLDGTAPIDQDGDGDVGDAQDIGYGRPTSCTIDGGACPNIPTNGFAPFGNPTTVQSNNYASIGCGTELYTVRVTFEKQNASDATRIVESKYAIRCQNPE